MKIAIITPSLEPYGGVRVILNWCKYLAKYENEVTLHVLNPPFRQNWFELPDEVKIEVGYPRSLRPYHITIGTNPDIVNHIRHMQGQKIYLCQMAEEYFFPEDANYVRKCQSAALVNFPMITVADWVGAHYIGLGRTAPTHTVRNGVDSEFRIMSPTMREVDTFLIEGWEVNNEAKDVENLVRHAARMIRHELPGARIIAYGQQPLQSDEDLIDEYYVRPTTRELATLYNRSVFLLKASQYETRSLAPLEAIACGCFPVVSIKVGHPDLKHAYNCFRSYYDLDDYIDTVREAIDWKKYNLPVSNTPVHRWTDVMEEIIPLLKYYSGVI